MEDQLDDYSDENVENEGNEFTDDDLEIQHKVLDEQLKNALKKKNTLTQFLMDEIKKRDQLLDDITLQQDESAPMFRLKNMEEPSIGDILKTDWLERREKLSKIQNKLTDEEEKDLKLIEAMEKISEGMAKVLAAHKIECKEMTDKIISLETHNDDLKLMVEKQEELKTQQEIEIMEKSIEIEILQSCSNQLQKDKRDKTDEGERVRKELNAKIYHQNEVNEELKKQIREKTDEIKDLKNEHSNELLRMQLKEKEISTLKKQIEDGDKKRHDLKEQNRKWKEVVKRKDGKNEKMEEKITLMDKQIKDLDEVDKKNKEKLQVLEKEKKKLHYKVICLEDQLKVQNKTIEELEINKRKTEASLKVMMENSDQKIPTVAELNRKRFVKSKHHTQLRQGSEEGRIGKYKNAVLHIFCLFCLFICFIYSVPFFFFFLFLYFFFTDNHP